MNKETTHAIQRTDGVEVAEALEQTRTGPVFTPAVDIFESGDSITVLADMPGVKPEALQIDLRENVLTLQGQVAEVEGDAEEEVVTEYETGLFHRRFTLSDAIDQDKIEAKLIDGVLRLALPKSEARKPRQIPVVAG